MPRLKVHNMPHGSRRQMASRPNPRVQIASSSYSLVKGMRWNGKVKQAWTFWAWKIADSTLKLGPAPPLLVISFLLIFYLFTCFIFILN